MTKKYYWYRTVMNGYEPDNRIKVVAELVGKEYLPFELWGYLTFKDGSSIISIDRNEDGTFSWQNDDRQGTAATFEEAYKNLPALITKPDHFEDGEILEL